MGAFTFRVDSDFVDVKRYLNTIEKELRPKAVVPALNKTADKVRTEIVRKISTEQKIKQKILRRQIKVVRARRGTAKVTARNYAIVDASDSKTINLIEFVKPSKRKPGYFNKRIGRGKKRKYRAEGVIADTGKGNAVWKGTFIGTNKHGEPKVYKRRGKARNEIFMVSGARPGQYFRRPKTTEFMRQVAIKHFPIELQRAVRAIIARSKK